MIVGVCLALDIDARPAASGCRADQKHPDGFEGQSAAPQQAALEADGSKAMRSFRVLVQRAWRRDCTSDAIEQLGPKVPRKFNPLGFAIV
jgi:hypothetical protein